MIPDSSLKMGFLILFANFAKKITMISRIIHEQMASRIGKGKAILLVGPR